MTLKTFYMTKLFKLAVIFFTLFLTVSCVSRRAVVVQETVVVQQPPMWAPMGFGDARFLFIPDMMVYYDMQSGMFLYPRGNRWVGNQFLPRHYSNFDLFNTHVVVINNYYGPSPYMMFNQHRSMYPVGFRGNPYQTIGRREQDTRQYIAGRRNNTAQSSRGQTAGNGRQMASNVGRNEAGTSRGQSSTVGRANNATRNQNADNATDRNNTRVNQQGGRGENATTPETTSGNSTQAPSRNNTAPAPSTRQQSAPANPRSNAVSPSNSVRTNPQALPNNRMSGQDARAVQQRTKQIKAQSAPARTSTSPATSGNRSTNTTTNRSGGRGGR